MDDCKTELFEPLLLFQKEFKTSWQSSKEKKTDVSVLG